MLARAALIAPVIAACLCGASLAADKPDMAEMQAKANAWIAGTAGQSDSHSAQLQFTLLDNCKTGLVDIFSQNWAAVTAHVDTAIAALPVVPESSFGQPAGTLDLAGKNGGENFATIAKQEGAFLCLRFYEPEVLANNGYQMLTSSKLQPDDIARNAILGNFMSTDLFATTYDGQPALGLTKGLWTVVTAYGRTEHGLLVPRAAASYPRLKQD